MKIISLALVVAGVVIAILGIEGINSFSDISTFFTEAPTNTGVWMLIGGLVATVVGLIGSLRSPRAATAIRDN